MLDSQCDASRYERRRGLKLFSYVDKAAPLRRCSSQQVLEDFNTRHKTGSCGRIVNRGGHSLDATMAAILLDNTSSLKEERSKHHRDFFSHFSFFVHLTNNILRRDSDAMVYRLCPCIQSCLLIEGSMLCILKAARMCKVLFSLAYIQWLNATSSGEITWQKEPHYHGSGNHEAVKLHNRFSMEIFSWCKPLTRC